MTDNPFKAGDVVILKSGGPHMTVGEIQGGRCACVWFNGGDVSSETFLSVLLSVATAGRYEVGVPCE